MNNYPLFTPPDHLAEKGAKNWTKKEAQEYFNWFLAIKAKRISKMLEFLGYSLTSNTYSDIDALNNKIYSCLCDSSFHNIRETDSSRALNNYGFALAADFGLFLASLLEESSKNLSWIIGRGPKSYHSYNQPVLSGFSNGEYDFLFLSINKSGYAINHLKHPYDWVSFYKELEDKSK